MRCKKPGLKIPNTPPPTLWKSSIHAGSAHITCRKTVRMCSTWRLIHFRFLAHSLANARSLGCGERTIQSLLWQRLQLVNQQQYSRHISLPCHLCLLTFASNAAPTMTFCAVSRLRLFAFRRCNLASASAIFCSSVLLMM